MIIKNTYTSIACNRTTQSADWGTNDLILFAAGHNCAIFNPKFNESSKITKTFAKHTKRVNTVKWVQNGEKSEDEFISGANDGLAIYWDISNSDDIKTLSLKGHTSAVTCLDSIYLNNNLTVVTASTDSTIRFWSKNLDEFVNFQTINLKTGLCFALKMSLLPGTDNILLAIATDDEKIHLWAENEEKERSFVLVDSLIGHENWVRGLDFVEDENKDLLLASSSQDSFIRLWRIKPKVLIEKLDDGEIQIEERIFESQKKQFCLGLESVLQGHDGWVYGVHWSKDKETGKIQLLSSSIDKTLIIWEMIENGIWMEKVRVGDVGGNSLGFFGGKFSPNHRSIMGHGYQGSFHIWHQSDEEKSSWKPGVVCGGHFSEVRDIGWEPEGQFLLSVSADQTTRIHAPWNRDNKEITWHEIARPQVHGYDMQCISVLSRYKFASGAEEKIIRTFQAPGNFVENFKRLTGVSLDREGDQIIESTPHGASVPSLGLSNKAVYSNVEVEETKHIKDMYPENYFVASSFNEPPPEEELMQNTLWPEIHKLYGHGYEIFSICATSDGKIIASSCKATTAEHAQIILWDTSSWKIIQKLSSHQLTVTQMKFSPDNKHLLSVSRDRRWTLFEKGEQGLFTQLATTDKKNGIHSRIIWTCDWSHDSLFFVTGSRDGKLVSWTNSGSDTDSSLGQYVSSGILELKNESITAVSFDHKFFDTNSYLVGLGLESGSIHLYSFNKEWIKLASIGNSDAHHLTVRKLAFRPNLKDKYQLASCGDDNLVRVYEIVV